MRMYGEAMYERMVWDLALGCLTIAVKVSSLECRSSILSFRKCLAVPSRLPGTLTSDLPQRIPQSGSHAHRV